MVRQWFAVKAKPRQEIQAAETLAQRGVEAYVPRIPPRRRAGQRPARSQALFPGYFFARVALGTSEWVVARSAPGVAYFVGPPSAPTAVPDALVEQIRLRSDESFRLGWRPPFRRGDPVRIAQGPFEGLDAIFEGSLSSKGRVRVLLELVSRSVVVDLEVGLLRARARVCDERILGAVV